MLNNINKKYLMLGGIILGSVVIIVLILVIISATKGGKVTYKDIENQMYKASINYYKKHEKDLPKKDGATVSISIDKLIKSGNLSDFKDRLDENVSCDGEVRITNNNDNYIYLPYLDCKKEYKTENLADKIIETDNLNEIGEGLYNVEDNYIFRGENVNNYIKFAGRNWRIIRINEDGTIKIILPERIDQTTWDDRYNVDKKFNSGINGYNMSRIKDTLQELYNSEELFNDSDREKMMTWEVCIGNREIESSINDGSLECSSTVADQQLGLIQLNEYMNPSLDENCLKPSDRSCANYNYLATFERSYWTITADADTSYMVYYVDNYADLKQAGSVSGLNPVVILTKNLIYDGGNGTLEEPYKIKNFKK